MLTGGGAATCYAPHAIQSFDLDFVLEVYSERGAPGRVLEELGYELIGQDYRHSASSFQLEFPRGPLAIGHERIHAWDTIHEEGHVLHVITPTDSCRDRLAAFYHFSDRSALDQACAVFRAQIQRVDLEVVRRWSEAEGQLERFEQFETLIAPVV